MGSACCRHSPFRRVTTISTGMCLVCLYHPLKICQLKVALSNHSSPHCGLSERILHRPETCYLFIHLSASPWIAGALLFRPSSIIGVKWNRDVGCLHTISNVVWRQTTAIRHRSRCAALALRFKRRKELIEKFMWPTVKDTHEIHP